MQQSNLARPSKCGEYMWEKKTPNGISRGFVLNIKQAFAQKDAKVWEGRFGGWIALN